MIVYRAVCLINGKSYVGQTKHLLDHRRRDHEKGAIKKESKQLFHKALKKYGVDNFVWGIICECNSFEELNEQEIFWIKQFNTIAPNGYNISAGGRSSHDNLAGWSDSKKKKLYKNISEKNKNRIAIKNLALHEVRLVKLDEVQMYLESGWEYGKFPMKDETKEKLSKRNIGKTHSNETKQKMKHSQSLRLNDPNYISPVRTKETRALISEINKNKIWVKNIELNQMKHIDKCELDTYLNAGWVRGRLDCMTDSVRVGISEKLKNKIWIRNIELQKQFSVNPDQLEEYLKLGWEKGKLPMHKTHKGTVLMIPPDNTAMKKVKVESVPDYINNGWKLKSNRKRRSDEKQLI